jgi:hypothetical protein
MTSKAVIPIATSQHQKWFYNIGPSRRNCFVLRDGKWSENSPLIFSRRFASMTSLENTNYVIGGEKVVITLKLFVFVADDRTK